MPVLSRRLRVLCALAFVALLAPGAAWAALPAPASTALPGVPGATAGPWGAWRAETVDDGFVTHEPSIAVGKDGLARIAYSGTGEDIIYAVRDGQSWQKTVIGKGILASIALDSEDRPHVTWAKRNPSDFDLYYAYFDGSAWTAEVADAVGYAGFWSDVAVDAQGRVHVVYEKNKVGLMYGLRTSLGWQIELVDSDSRPLWSGLDLDAQGNPHVAYEAPGGGGWGRLKYATRIVGGGWAIEEIDSRGGTECDIVIDSHGRVHISFMEEGEVLGYAHYNGTAWIFERADLQGPTGWYTAIDTDSHNVPHISYWQVTNRGNTNDPLRGHLKYATRLPTGQWATEFIEPMGWADRPAIAVDPDDRPRVAYVYVTDQLPPKVKYDLKYAEPIPATLLRPTQGLAP